MQDIVIKDELIGKLFQELDNCWDNFLVLKKHKYNGYYVYVLKYKKTSLLHKSFILNTRYVREIC